MTSLKKHNNGTSSDHVIIIIMLLALVAAVVQPLVCLLPPLASLPPLLRAAETQHVAALLGAVLVTVGIEPYKPNLALNFGLSRTRRWCAMATLQRFVTVHLFLVLDRHEQDRRTLLGLSALIK